MIVLIKQFLRPAKKIWTFCREWLCHRRQAKRLENIFPEHLKRNIFYLGITMHSNLGDMAQYYCIQNWLAYNYGDCNIYEFDAPAVVDRRFHFVTLLKERLRPGDIIVFQSGYTTQDLGGVHEYMHRLIIDNMPDANILMMPQTIYFQKEENKKRTAASYNRARHMLFLARDMVSYNMAIDMFPAVKVLAYPDIVTSLIGHFKFDAPRQGILICRRNDSEKYYSEEELLHLRDDLVQDEPVIISDTSINVSYKKIQKNPERYINDIINSYSKYKLIITDRYHGTIFSLAANTPVIVLKTTDHKVTTGVTWFKGVYDGYVFAVSSLEEAASLARKILKSPPEYHLASYFDEQYYGKLKTIVEDVIKHK